MDLVSTVVVLFVTFTAIIVGFYAYGMSNLQEIKDNWVQYRCNPAYMPLAGAVGSDIMTNFTYCTMQSVQTYAGFVMDPIFNAFKQLQDVIFTILGSLQFIRKKIAGTADAFLGIVSSVFGKIQNTLVTTGQLFGKMRTIMYRIMSIFVVLIHITTTGIQTGSSIDNGPIGEVGRFLCFDPDTNIGLYGGGNKHICDLNPGDMLSGGQEVDSVMLFDGAATPMVDIFGIKVSGNHKILCGKRWISCKDHPDAFPTDSLPVIVCLNTTSHTIPIRGMLFKDYEETDDIHEFYQDVAEHYGLSDIPPMRFQYRTTGFDKDFTNVVMSDGSVKCINDIRLGECVKEGGRVIGAIVHRLNVAKVEVGNGIFVAPGTMVFKDKLTTAAPPLYTPYGKPIGDGLCMNLITEKSIIVAVDNHGVEYRCLDDHEVPDSRIHDKRDQKVIHS